jgi:hypothetical protein
MTCGLLKCLSGVSDLVVCVCGRNETDDEITSLHRHFYFFGCSAMYSSVFIPSQWIFINAHHWRSNHEEPQPTRPFFGPGAVIRRRRPWRGKKWALPMVHLARIETVEMYEWPTIFSLFDVLNQLRTTTAPGVRRPQQSKANAFEKHLVGPKTLVGFL